MEDNNGLILTLSQAKAIEEFKSRMSDDLDEEYKTFNETHLFYRFLKAREWDQTKAENMLKKSLQWRKENCSILKDYKPPELLRRYFANYKFGYDKEECPVFYVPTGRYDVKGLRMSARFSDIEKAVYQINAFHENCIEEESKKKNQRLLGFVVIFDKTGLTFGNATDKWGFELFIRLTKMQQDRFPERLKTIYFINAPSYFTIPFNIAKNFLSLRTQQKIKVYGTENWKEELSKVMDADQLPVFMGGTRTDPDGNPLCKTFLNQGGFIDESYYIHKSRKPLVNSPGVEKLQIPRTSSTQISVKVPEPGSVIEWEFETRSGDIGFCILFKTVDEGEDLKVVVPLQRLHTKDFAETGLYKCEVPGEYVVVFDNSYSWFWSKEVIYRIKVLMPKELENQIIG